MLQPNKQTAIYCRTAHFDKEGFAIECQKQRMLRYADEHGMCNPVLYIDNGFSGLTLERPSFLEMQAAIVNGNVETVLSADLSRIGRNVFEVLPWIDGIEKLGVRVVIADTPDLSGLFRFAGQIGGAL